MLVFKELVIAIPHGDDAHFDPAWSLILTKGR